jgi:hypothetical protein
MIAITRRIFIKPIDATPKPSAIRCQHCGARDARSIVAKRAAMPADDGAAPRLAA